MSYSPNSDPITLADAQEYVPQWGSLISNGDPGYICYTAIPPEAAAHRDAMVAYLHNICRPIASEEAGDDGDDYEYSDVEQIDRVCEYLNAITY